MKTLIAMLEFYRHRNLIHYALWPLGQIYGLGARIRQNIQTPDKAARPVICVGNATLGGAGKTPIVAALADYFSAQNYTPHIISRGYNRKTTDTLRVNPTLHSATDVGDEPLMLAQTHPVWVTNNRAQAAQAAIQDNADLLILDDGYQNQSLHKDIHILVTDTDFGFGNQFIFPAGPLRENLNDAINRADLHVLFHSGGENNNIQMKLGTPCMAVSAQIQNPETLPNGPWTVFCGLANTNKFLATAKIAAEMRGAHIVAHRTFADHHPYSDHDKIKLIQWQQKYKAALITSEKDLMRFNPKERKNLHTIKIKACLNKPLLNEFFAMQNLPPPASP